MPFTNNPFYDPNKSYQENFDNGPFGAFSTDETYQLNGEPKHNFLGNKVYLPLGIPAGPLPNANFVKAAFKKGFDLPVYKTVRTGAHPCHPWPNVLAVHPHKTLTPQNALQGLVADDKYTQPIAITNSFGVPSTDPDIWQPDMKQAVKAAGKGQVMIGSFQGTNRGKGMQAFIDDYVLGAKLVTETGANILVANLSCPNEGKAELLCFDTDTVEQITHAIKDAIGNTPLLIKLAYFVDDTHLSEYMQRIGKIVDGMIAINTIFSKVVDKDGKQALPGEGRSHSGVCGEPIKHLGLDMIERMHQFRQQFNLDVMLGGTGGVTTPDDYQIYRDAGADAVFSATGAMWNPWLAKEAKECL